MKTKNLKYYISVALIFALAAMSVVYAASMYSLSYVERFETDRVDINIQEISAIEDGQKADEQPLAEANKDLSYVPRIHNRAADCYVRAKVTINMDGECEQPLGLNNIYGLNKDWVYLGDYFYYTKILLGGHQIDIFEGLHIPEDWEYGDSDSVGIDVKAEAVQSANFKPDFNCNLPWGSVELKSVVSSSGSEFAEAVPVSSISKVEYDSDGGFQCNTSELFDEFTGIMPGDSCEKTVKLKNSAKNALKISLKITAAESEFNKKMNLKIFSDDTELYSGTIAEASRVKALDITDIPRGRTGDITFRVFLPTDADNTYAAVKDNAVWNLNVEEVSDSSVQTADFSDIKPYVVVAALALLMMLYAVIHNRKDRNGTRN